MNLADALHQALSEQEEIDPMVSNFTEDGPSHSVRLDGVYNLDLAVDRAIELMEVD